MQGLKTIAAAVDAEVRDSPDHLPKEVRDRSNIEELQLQAFVAALQDLEARLSGSARLVGLMPTVGFVQRTEEVLAQLCVGSAAHVLCEVPAVRGEHPCDLAPVDTHGMSTADEIERFISERKRLAVAAGHDVRAQRPEQLRCANDVRSPSFGCDHQPGQAITADASKHLAATRLYVEGGGRIWKSRAE